MNWLFARADQSRLRAASSPLPGRGPFTVYRGVAGRGRARRVRGLSWTLERRCAAWFGMRFAQDGLLPDPAVFCATVPDAAVLAYLTDEQECIVDLPTHIRPVRIRDIDLAAEAQAWKDSRPDPLALLKNG